ncbi:MAG: GDP-mannose 4,6-dehydratase, partial [Candidatus Omnitrophica bacterium]|nr:GDP-mannose 4,6-dehydratase [Candidatus Omnitrophota bacterium]
GVNGEFTDTKPFTEYDIPNPVGAYAVSKWEAEQALRKVAENTGMEVVILRPPLVYGPDAPGNFGRLIHLIQLGLPIPLGDIKNSRSFIYLGNLVDAIITCISHPLAAGETFLVSDGQDVSTPDLIKMIASAMNKKLVLFSLPPSILKGLCRIMGKAEELEKLTGTLLVDSSKIRNMLGWRPPFTLEEGIRETVKESRLPACRQASPATKSMA